MGRMDAPTIAARAGVDEALVTRLAERGLLRRDESGRFDEADVRRVQLLQVLERSGLALEGLAAMVAQGWITLEFIDAATYQAFSPLSDETFGQVSARTAIPLDLLLAIREAVGGTGAGPADRVREDELLIVPLVEFQLDEGFRPVAIERALRV